MTQCLTREESLLRPENTPALCFCNVAEAILAGGRNEAPAILYKGNVVTYAELRQLVTQSAAGLLARGLSKGARVGIWSENSPFFVAAYLGIIRAGLVAVPLQTEATAETFSAIVLEAGIGHVLVSQRFEKRLHPWAAQARVKLLTETIWQDQLEPNDSTLAEIDPKVDLAALMFTSGSTGQPKGVMVTHRNIECNTRDIIAYMGLGSSDRVMAVLPFHYCFGASLLHTHLMAGGSLVLNNDFRLYPEVVLREMQECQCTGLAGVPSTYQLLLRKSRFRQLSFPNLRWFQQAGGKLPNPCIAEILASFPQVRYFLMYGQTEGTARLSYLPPDYLAAKLGSIGKGLPSTRLQVVKPDGTPVQPGSDEVGEIIASGDNISQGYWNDLAETDKYFRDGELHTGDLARVDEDGFIFIVERERDMIKSSGNRVSAKEIEDVIAEIPEVVEVAVVGEPHELKGEAIVAFVSPIKVTLTAEHVKAHCRQRLPAFKTPEEVILLKYLPHNGAGKVMKGRLREVFRDTNSGLTQSIAI